MAFQQQRTRTSKRTNQQWVPNQVDIEVATSLLKSQLLETQKVAQKQSDSQDFFAMLALSSTLHFCLNVLPPEVASIARANYEAIQDLYSLPESEG